MYKKTASLLTFLIVIAFLLSAGSSTNRSPVAAIPFEYLELEFRFGLNGGVKAATSSTIPSHEDLARQINTKSASEAFNFMSLNGWELHLVYKSENKRGAGGNAYLFKKPNP